ncbi:hypothetical protein LMORI2_11360 [Limnohabitans sp. MORI2]|jgi:hypothetical protein|uniref:DUF3619 family protein n=1 Tax=Limnohabitans sp. MORI2 TaxID=1751150 RepID=UPI00237795DA|nr:DUF3619 family protein [Limnohabitans sp. MORI2]BDU58154.1 hypothetical protein LMORI2_11360 [Limnohabitans sp. MORI2]
MTHTANTQDEFGLRIAARLNSASLELPHDISERLRAARTRAVAARLKPQSRLQTSSGLVQQNGTALLNFGSDEGLNIWSRLASLLPLIALVAGLALIQNIMDDDRANELAEVDSALLVDDLPPSAYADPGFLQFLKNPLALSESKE